MKTKTPKRSPSDSSAPGAMVPHRVTTARLSELVDNPDNPRPPLSAASVADLRASIARHGLLQPLVVARGLPNLSGAMIVCGHRRAAALRGLLAPDAEIPVLELTIPATVANAEGDPSEAIRREVDLAALVENGQRLELDPIREGQALAEILSRSEGRLSVEDLAGDLGRSRAYVEDRLQVAKLSPRWTRALRNELEEQEPAKGKRGGLYALEPFRCDSWPLRWLVAVSVLNHALQDELLDEWIREEYERPQSLRDLRSTVSGKLQTLGRAPFDLNRDGIAGVVSCAKCPKHTMARPALFDEPTPPKVLAGARCPDADCYARKTAAALRDAVEASKAKHPGVLVVGYDPEDVKGAELGDSVKLCSHYQVEPAKKSDKGATPAIVQGSGGDPKVVYVREIARSSTIDKASRKPKGEPTRPKTLKEKRAALELRRMRFQANALADLIQARSAEEWLSTWPTSKNFHPWSVLALASVFGVQADSHAAKEWAKRLAVGGANAHDVKVFAKRVANELARLSKWHDLESVSAMVTVAGWGLGFTTNELTDLSIRACEEIPEPAAWSKVQATPAAKSKGKAKGKAKAEPKAPSARVKAAKAALDASKAKVATTPKKAKRAAKGKAAAAGDTDDDEAPGRRPPFTPAPLELADTFRREFVTELEARATTDRCAECGAAVVWWRAPSGADVALERASAILVAEKGGRLFLLLRHRCTPRPPWKGSTDAS